MTKQIVKDPKNRAKKNKKKNKIQNQLPETLFTSLIGTLVTIFFFSFPFQIEKFISYACVRMGKSKWDKGRQWKGK